jgi:DNA-binding MarR family transcriptional regulator
VAADPDQFDINTLRIDPTDPAYVPRASGAAKTRKKKWERKFIHFPWSWLDRLKLTRLRATWALALLLIYEHWRTGGRAIKLTNAMAAEVGVSPDTKGPALDELEKAGLIEVERHCRKSPLVTLMVKPSAGHS